MRLYAMSNEAVLRAMMAHYGITDHISALQLDRRARIVRTDRSDQTWRVPDHWDLS